MEWVARRLMQRLRCDARRTKRSIESRARRVPSDEFACGVSGNWGNLSSVPNVASACANDWLDAFLHCLGKRIVEIDRLRRTLGCIHAKKGQDAHNRLVLMNTQQATGIRVTNGQSVFSRRSRF